MKRVVFLSVCVGLLTAGLMGRGWIREVAADLIEGFYGDPDMPWQLDVGLNKDEYLNLRAKGVEMKRGIDTEDLGSFDPTLRSNAIRQLDRQEKTRSKIKDAAVRDSLLAAWTEIGPGPIPNGQTNNPAVSVPVSGRVTAIDVHPTNPNVAYVGTAQGGFYRTLDGGVTWTPLMDNAMSLAIGAVTIDPLNPSIVFVGTGESNQSGDCYAGVGLYRIDSADTSPVLNGPFETRVAGTGSVAGNGHAFNATGISKIVVDPANDNRIFVGSTWSFGGVSGDIFPVNTGTNGSWGLFFSENAKGANPVFSLVANPAFVDGQQAVTDMVFEPGSSNNLLVGIKDFTGNNSGVFRSTNAAAASVAGNVAPGLTRTLNAGRVRVSLAINKVGATVNVLAAREGGSGNILLSTDGGATWPTTLSAAGGFCGAGCFYNMVMALDPTTPNNILIGGQFTAPAVPLQKSTNGGTSFSDASAGLHADTHAIVFAPSNPQVIWEGNDGGVWRSTNGGNTWTNLNNSSFKATQFVSLAVHPSDPNFTIGGTQDNGTNFYKTDGTWTNIQVGDGGAAVIDQNAADTTNVRMFHTFFSTTTTIGYERVTSVNNANSGGWTFFGCGFGGITANGMTCSATAILFFAPMEQGPGNPNTLYFGSDVLYRSADGGTSMAKVSQEPIVSGVAISAIGISPQNDNVRVVGLRDGGLYATTSGASTLTNIDPANTVPDKYVARTVVDPANANVAYVTLSAFGVNSIWKTSNLSATPPTWTAVSSGLPQIPVNAFVVDPLNSNNLYAGTDIGVYTSGDAGTTWTPFGTGLPRVAVFDMAITGGSSRMLRIATHGRGMWQIPLAPAAAFATVGGRVLTSDGRGLRNAVVKITGPNNSVRTATTSSFGFYSFDNVATGSSYTISISSRQYRYAPLSLPVTSDLLNIDFVGLELVFALTRIRWRLSSRLFRASVSFLPRPVRQRGHSGDKRCREKTLTNNCPLPTI